MADKIKTQASGFGTRQIILIAAATGLVTIVLTLLSFRAGSFGAGSAEWPAEPISWPLLIHLVTVIPAVPIGGWLLLRRRKGDRLHRWLGRSWAVLMLTTAVATLWLTGPSGRFSFIHIFSLVTFISVPRSVLAIRRGDTKTHRYAVIGSYVGLIVAGLFAFLPGRLLYNWTFG